MSKIWHLALLYIHVNLDQFIRTSAADVEREHGVGTSALMSVFDLKIDLFASNLSREGMVTRSTKA